MIDNQGIINLSSKRSKIYASVALKDSDVAFLNEGEDAAFFPFLSWVLFIHSIA